MSGGSLDYFYCQLQEHAGDFKDKELDELVQDLAELFHDREWYLSGDICEGAWNEARDNFKKKWFSDGARAERIEKCLDETKAELFKSFGIYTKYCETCKNWIKEKEGSYGNCKVHKHCLMHRCETCKDWEAKK